MQRKKWQWLCTLFVVLIALSGCSVEEENLPQLLGTIEGCDVATERCTFHAEGVSGSLRLGPHVKPLLAFPIHLSLEASQTIDQRTVVMDFQMQGMDMGMNRYRLQQVTDTTWQGTATLPVCTASRMDWKAIVEFSMNGRKYQLEFLFHTEAN